ncbi:hypothetical protein DYB32_008070, partial [Aphanomyces invadans]
LGRVLFGLGGESLGVAQSTLVASWFKNKELAMALGINLSIARLGSVFNNELSPEIASEYNVSSALWVGVIMCGVSLIAALTLIPIDKRADAAIARAARHPSSSSLPVKKSDQSMSFNDLRQFGPLFWLLSMSCLVVYGCVIPFNSVASSLLMERDFFKSPPIECRRCDVGAYATHNCTTLAPSCPSVPPFAWPLPALNQNCSTITTAAEQDLCSHLPPYIDERSINCDSDAWKHGTYSRDFCKHKSAAASAAATPMSVPYLMSAVLSPFMGFAVDRVGCRAFLALAAALTLVVVHLLLGLTDATYWLPLSLQGLAYCVFAAALWPSIPCTVPAEVHTTSYLVGRLKDVLVLVMADVDDDVCVSVSFSSSLTFPTGFARMFKADASPNMTLDAPSAVMSFEAPTVVTTALNESTCDDCSYDVYFSPAQSSSAVPPVLPSMCLYASNLECKTLSDSSGGHSGRILDLHRSFDEGWYHIYLIATIPGMSRPSMFVYTPTTVFLSRSIAWTNSMSTPHLDRNSTICNAVIVLWNNKCKLQALRQWREFTIAENDRLRDMFVRRVRTATKEILVGKAIATSSRTTTDDAGGHATALTASDVDMLVTWAVEIQTKSFAGVHRSVVEDVVQNMALRTYPDKACLFMEGDVGQFYYILFSGTVGIYVGMPPESKALAATSHGQAMKCIRTDPAFLGRVHSVRLVLPTGDDDCRTIGRDVLDGRTAHCLGPHRLRRHHITFRAQVYQRTLRAYHYATYSKAQKIAFLPSVDIFADWLQVKIAAVSDLLERHELSFGFRVFTFDRPMEAVYFVVSGDFQVTQRWHEPVLEHPPALPEFKATPKRSIDIQVERVTRRGVLGLPLLLSDGVKAKVDVTVVTATADVYILKQANLAAFRALLPTSGTHVDQTSH